MGFYEINDSVFRSDKVSKVGKARARIGLIALFVILLALLAFGWRYYQGNSAMNPGLKIKFLHEQGIDGSGVSVAIIDQKLLIDHVEYAGRLKHYAQIGSLDDEPNSMHGPAVTSILAGKNCGVAPGVNLYYWAVAVNGTEPAGVRYARAIMDIVEFNENFPPNERIRIISTSIGFHDQEGGNEFAAAIKDAQEAGILVFTSTYPYFTDPILAVYGAALRKGGSRDKSDDYIVQPVVVEYQEQAAEVIVSVRHQRCAEAGYAPVWVPVEPRVLASERGVAKYARFDIGGDSWATPYVAGIVALIIQVNPQLTNTQVAQIIAETATANRNGLLMINPEMAVAAAKKR